MANKIKHSKLKNTGVLFELLVRQITTDTLNGIEKSQALKIVKEFFAKGSDLKNELNLYNSLLKEKFNSKNQADKFIDVVLSERSKLSSIKLKRSKYNLIKEINSSYGLEDFFRTKISDYRLNASIYKLFEAKVNKDVNNPKEFMSHKDTLIEHVSGKKLKTIQEKIIKEYSKQDKSLRLLSYKILLEKFNEKYGKSLNDNQQELLRTYINGNSKDVVSYLNEQSSSSRKIITAFSNKLDDKITSIKLKEVSNQLRKIEKTKRVNESHLATMMNVYELIKECRRVNR